MDILTFLGHDYRVASLIIMYFVVPGISIPKIRSHKNLSMFKVDIRTFW